MEYVQKLPYSLKFVGIPLKGSNGVLSIAAQVILKRKKFQLQTGLQCTASEWDKDQGNFYPTSAHAKYQMNKLAQYEGFVHEKFLELKSSNTEVTAASLKGIITGQEEAGNSLLSFMDDYVKMISDRNEYCSATISRYKKVRSYMSDFLGTKGIRDLQVSEFKRSHLVAFQHYLLSTRNALLKKPISRVTSNTYIKKLHVVINEAIALELIERDPFVGFKLENVKVKKEFLTLAEVRLLSEYEFEKPHLTDIAKNYLFCAACGLRFADAMALKRVNITIDDDGQHWLSIEQMKTKVPLTVPMFRVAVEIHDYFLAKYPTMTTVLKPVTNQGANRALKHIASLVGIQKHLKFHSSRHTFACSLIQQGADLFATSKLMGHTNVSSTQIYAQMSTSRVLEVVKGLDQK